MTWRPEGWKNPFRGTVAGYEERVFEAGADAMLGMLKEMGERVEIGDSIDEDVIGYIQSGWAIFIPDDS